MLVVDKLELAIIAFVSIGAYLLNDEVPSQVHLGFCVVWLAAIIFIQSLVRDVSRIAQMSVSHRNNVNENISESRCLCLESMVGVSVLLIGFLLFFATSATVINVNNASLSVTVFIALILGFLMRNLVVFLKPFRIRHEKEHMTIRVKW